MFGRQNVEETTVDNGNGDQIPAVLIFNERPNERIQVTWIDHKPDSGIELVSLCTADTKACRWHTREGITIGTSLKQVEKLNGGSFNLSGWGWDGWGYVMSWNGGLLEKAFPSRRAWLRFNPPSPQDRPDLRLQYNETEGDKVFSSRLPAMQTLNPAVYQLDLDFDGCPGAAKHIGPPYEP